MSANLAAMAAAYVGRRVELAPHLDAWMAGDRFGTIVRVSGRGFRVRLDAPVPRAGFLDTCVKCGARVRYDAPGRNHPAGWSGGHGRNVGRLCDNGGLHQVAPATGRELTLTNDQIKRCVS